ncbi:MAG: hypothetical protein HeimC3_01700 [Candidatus Heimdallarchaeota archaeon LC_3]|nr:MAG: hypothetical protein HeimC3_01700 [Candidatus Heimdallarchaeota archaeon LC_3]
MINESNNSFFNGNITINKNYLVFPVNSSIFTISIPMILSLIVYGILVIFSESVFSSLLNSIYTLEVAVILGTFLTLLVCLYWYRYWKLNFTQNNVINITINKSDQIVEFSRDVGERKKLDSYEIPFDYLINLVIGRSADGNADGWSLNLFIRNQQNRKKQDIFSVFIVNDEGLEDLYKFVQEMRIILEKMELSSFLRISDLFLRKVKERQEKKLL